MKMAANSDCNHNIILVQNIFIESQRYYKLFVVMDHYLEPQ